MIPLAFDDRYDPPPDDAREDARADARRESQDGRGWWPKWAIIAGIERPAPEHEDDRLF